MDEEQMKPVNELRYYMEMFAQELKDPNAKFKPTHMVTATRLPSGAVEIAINTAEIPSKIDYILDTYDDEMHLKTNPQIKMENVMIV